MNKTLLILAASVSLAACAAPAPEPICDREAQTYDKFGTPEDLCMRPKPRPIIPGLPDLDDPHDPTPPYPPAEPPSEPPVGEPPVPPSEPPSEPPSGKVKGNNGLGNGDQTAPGNSLSHNKAENEVGNPGHKSGKKQESN